MHTILKYILGIILLSGCGHVGKKNDNEKKLITPITTTDTINYQIIPFDSSTNVNSKFYRPTNLTSQEIIEIETLLLESVDNWNTENKEISICIKTYKRHYTPVINNKGEKEVWIYCACNGYFGMVSDGGKCYFRLKVNLTNKTFTRIEINSMA